MLPSFWSALEYICIFFTYHFRTSHECSEFVLAYSWPLLSFPSTFLYSRFAQFQFFFFDFFLPTNLSVFMPDYSLFLARFLSLIWHPVQVVNFVCFSLSLSLFCGFRIDSVCSLASYGNLCTVIADEAKLVIVLFMFFSSSFIVVIVDNLFCDDLCAANLKISVLIENYGRKCNLHLKTKLLVRKTNSKRAWWHFSNWPCTSRMSLCIVLGLKNSSNYGCWREKCHLSLLPLLKYYGLKMSWLDWCTNKEWQRKIMCRLFIFLFNFSFLPSHTGGLTENKK